MLLRPFVRRVLLGLGLTAPALAADISTPDQRVVYDLSMNGEKVGHRDLSVHYAMRNGVERRVVEAYTELTVAGTAIVCRTTGFSGPHGATFTTSIDQGGAISQIQGVELPTGGWRVIVSDGAHTTERTLTADQARFSSLDPLDPQRVQGLSAPGPAGIVLVESGDVVAGTLGEPVEGTAKIGTDKVRIQRFTLTGPLGQARFDVDENGFLLRSELQWLGGTIVASARTLPPPRSFGEVEKLDAAPSTMVEEPL